MIVVTFRIIAAIQLILGCAYLFAPAAFLRAVGHSAAAPDLQYPLAMLGARFVAYGIGLWWASSAPAPHVGWIRLMALIQGIDLAAGAYFTLRGVVPLSLSAFPMFNALWIGMVCWLWRPRSRDVVAG